MFRLMLLTTIFSLFALLTDASGLRFLLNNFTFAKEEAMPTFTVSKVFTTRDGIHTTTRGTIRLVFAHEGKWLVFHGGPNMYQRWQSGELYLMKYDGKTWSEPLLVSEPGTKYNWYPNMNEDVSKGIGVLYLKGMPKNQAAIKNTDFDIMFSSEARK